MNAATATRSPGRLQALLAMLATGLLVVGCAGGATSSPTATEPVEVTPTPAAEITPAPEPVTLRIAHINQPTTQAHLSVVEAAKRIEERTGGTLKFEIYPAGQLGTTDEVLQQAATGEPVIGYTDAAYLGTFGVPDMGILAGPFLVDNAEEADRLARSDLMAEWTEQLAEVASLRILALNWFDGPRHVFGVDREFPTPDTLNGVKIRIPPIKTWEETFKPLGAVPVTIQSSEIYSALQQNVVEAAEAPVAGIYGNKWYEVAKVVTKTAHFNLFLGWAMSDAVFQSLTPEQQTILVEEFLLGGVENTEASASNEASLIAEMESEHGLRFVDADVDAYREATLPFYDAFPEWSEGLYEDVQEAIGR